jgi:hypothetical protein
MSESINRESENSSENERIAIKTELMIHDSLFPKRFMLCRETI